MMQNILRTPWRIEPVDRWPGLFTVRDCDGNVVAAAKIEEVAKLIAEAPATRADFDQLVRALQYIQKRGLRLVEVETRDTNLARSEDPTGAELEATPSRRGFHVYVGKPDDGAIEDELSQDDFPAETLAEGWLEAAMDDDDPGETFLDYYGRPSGTGDIDPQQEESAELDYDYWWEQV